jgi:glutamyl-tRNA(Gln) amidotransferase subunit E
MKCGIEIHQRLATHKLFCNCPSEVLQPSEQTVKFSRRLHEVKSELGKRDSAAMAEAKKNLKYLYTTQPESGCLVEADEEPPHPMNAEALEIVLGVCQMLGSNHVDEVQVMRKIVIDGSNTAGFQRTAIVGIGGSIESSAGKVGILAVCIEEESAGIESKEGNKGNFLLDRLGIPLVEIATAPDIKSPEHAQEVAEKIGMTLRMSGAVLRGIGTIRQDVNISIEGGARVEIKGLQELGLVSKLVALEVQRQEKLLSVMAEAKNRFGGQVQIEEKVFDLTDIFSETECKLAKSTIDAGGKVMGIAVPKHAGLLGTELYPKRRYGSEVSDYAKMAGVLGIIHSDEDMGKYKISEDETAEICAAMGVGKQDAFILVADREEKARDALLFCIERLNMAHLPEETRKADIEGGSSFMRPLPGSARMYPETDIPPVRITPAMLKEAKKYSGEGLEEKKGKLAQLLNEQMAERMLKSRNLQLFERLLASKAEPMVIATALEETMTSLRRDGMSVDAVDEKRLYEMFELLSDGIFVKAAISPILTEMAASGCAAIDAVGKLGLQRISGKELQKIVEENAHDMQKIMGAYRLRVDAADVAKILKKK